MVKMLLARPRGPSSLHKLRSLFAKSPIMYPLREPSSTLRKTSPIPRKGFSVFYKREKLGWLYLPANLLAPCYRVGSGLYSEDWLHTGKDDSYGLFTYTNVPGTLHNNFLHNVITVVCRVQLRNSSTPRFRVQVPISAFY